MAAQVCFGGGFAEGEEWEGEEGDEASHSTSSAFGDSEGCGVCNSREEEVEGILDVVPRGQLSRSEARGILSIDVRWSDMPMYDGGSGRRKERRLSSAVMEEEGGKDGIT